jgi:hypothetical protein
MTNPRLGREAPRDTMAAAVKERMEIAVKKNCHRENRTLSARPPQ